MIKTYLVPITDELIKVMEKGEAPSFLHCATCLDGLTNGEVIQKIFKVSDTSEGMAAMFAYTRNDDMLTADIGWWNRKWGE